MVSCLILRVFVRFTLGRVVVKLIALRRESSLSWCFNLWLRVNYLSQFFTAINFILCQLYFMQAFRFFYSQSIKDKNIVLFELQFSRQSLTVFTVAGNYKLTGFNICHLHLSYNFFRCYSKIASQSVFMDITFLSVHFNNEFRQLSFIFEFKDWLKAESNISVLLNSNKVVIVLKGISQSVSQKFHINYLPSFIN